MSVNPLFISSSENKLEILVQPDTIVYSVIDENDKADGVAFAPWLPSPLLPKP